MKDNIFDISCIVVLLIIILATGIYLYKTITRDNDINALDDMMENIPEPIAEEKDELIIQEYEIDGKTYEVIAILYIPTIDIEYPVFSSTSKELLKVSLNKYWGPNPNKPGNFCIVGHNYNNEKFFGKLHNINVGEFIQLTDMSRKNFTIQSI